MAVRNGQADEALGDLYPFEDRFVDLSTGHCMHYIRMGRTGLRRPTFLLLHGTPTWSFLWRRFMAPLARIGQVIAVDHVGFGRSDHPEDRHYHSLDRHIHNLEELAQTLRLKRVVPVVHDWGGPIGLGYATRHPDALAGLVVMNTWAFTDRMPVKVPAVYRALRAPGVGEVLHQRRNVFVERLMPKANLRPIPPDVMDGYRHPFPTPASRAAILAFMRMVPTGPDHPDWPTLEGIEQGLPHLDVPAAILWASKDPAFGKRYAHSFHDALPDAQPPQWFEAGHYLQEDAPEELVAAVVDFAQQRL